MRTLFTALVALLFSNTGHAQPYVSGSWSLFSAKGSIVDGAISGSFNESTSGFNLEAGYEFDLNGVGLQVYGSAPSVSKITASTLLLDSNGNPSRGASASYEQATALAHGSYGQALRRGSISDLGKQPAQSGLPMPQAMIWVTPCSMRSAASMILSVGH